MVTLGDFPGGTVDKNPPANAGDTGSVPSLGRSHVPQSKLSPQPKLPMSPIARALQREDGTLQQRVAPALYN